MVAFIRSQGLTGVIPVAGGVVAGASAVALFTLLPADSLSSLVWSSGIAALVPAAAPPLGITARALLALGGGVVAAAVAWSALFLLFGPGGWLAPKARGAGVPAVRRGDAHPDCPPRRPMSATELGTPMMEINALPGERALPRDLDQPLHAFDPGSVPDVPREPVRAVAPLARPALAPGERLETFALDPLPAGPAIAPQRREPPSQETIEALLRRLEEGADRRSRA